MPFKFLTPPKNSVRSIEAPLDIPDVLSIARKLKDRRQASTVAIRSMASALQTEARRAASQR